MSQITFFLLSLLLWPKAVFAQKVIDSDTSIYKVQTQVYFLSDVEILENALKVLACQQKKAALFDFLPQVKNFKLASLKTHMQHLEGNTDKSATDLSVIEEMMTLSKLLLYGRENLWAKEQVQKIDLKASCLPKGVLQNQETLTLWSKELTLLSNFLSERFGGPKKNKNLTFDKFFKTIEKKYAHEWYL